MWHSLSVESMTRSKRIVPILAVVLLTGQVAWADADTLPTMGLGAGAFWAGTDKSLSLVTDLFLGVDVRAQDPVPGLRYPAFVARAHLLLGGTSRLEPRVYLVGHSSSWAAFLSGSEDTAFALGVGPSIPLGSNTSAKLSAGLFLQVTGANMLSLELGCRALAGPVDLSATIQFDAALGLRTLVRVMGGL
jgi:hypothetical protein